MQLMFERIFYLDYMENNWKWPTNLHEKQGCDNQILPLGPFKKLLAY